MCVFRIVTTGLFLCCCNISVGQQYVQFTRRATQEQDVARQSIRCDLAGERTIRQHQQIVDSSKQRLDRRQTRTLTILTVHDGKPVRARITYDDSKTTLVDNLGKSIEVQQPVTGQTYFAELRGEDLIITDSQGNRPTPEEEKIVKSNLEAFGKPNPLAQFLHGKRLRVGQTITVPKNVVQELMGLTGGVAAADSLALSLVRVESRDGRTCSVFQTSLRANSNEDVTTSLIMTGELIVEVDSCRVRSIALSGPVAISEQMGPAQGKFMVSTNGNLRVAVESRFDTLR